MTKKTDLDIKAAHKHFAGACFNQAWDLIEKPDRTPKEDEQMIRLNMASHWHWTQREDCTATTQSVGYWQASRIYAILGQADNARRYGQLCLDCSQEHGVEPFYLGYAYEALARAESVAGNSAKVQEYLAKAREIAEALPDPDYQKPLLDDLDTIK